MFVDELGQPCHRIRTDAKHHHATFFQLGFGIADTAGLGGAARGECLGVKKMTTGFLPLKDFNSTGLPS